MVIYDTYDNDDEMEKKYPKEEYYEKQKRRELNNRNKNIKNSRKCKNNLRSEQIKEDIDKKQNKILKSNPDLISAKTKLLEKRLERKKHIKLISYVIITFIVLFTISLRNSQIDEKFTQIKSLKSDLALLNKENEQLEVNIESNLNLKNIENIARDNLGMQKQTSAQTIYINLPTQDYIEPAKEENKIKQKAWYQEFWEYITNLL